MINKQKIAVVDDSTTMRAVARTGFERAGLTVYDAADEMDALQIVLNERPDVVLVDLFMPDFPTEQFIGRLREIRESQGTSMVILIYSGRSTEELRELTSEYGADGYIQKMQGIRMCVARVMAYLSRRGVPRPGSESER